MSSAIRLNPDEIDQNCNDIFKQVVVNRDWKNHQQELLNMYNSDNEQYRELLVDSLRTIMLKIMVIPQ